jgi:hypothetical protein
MCRTAAADSFGVGSVNEPRYGRISGIGCCVASVTRQRTQRAGDKSREQADGVGAISHPAPRVALRGEAYRYGGLNLSWVFQLRAASIQVGVTAL